MILFWPDIETFDIIHVKNMFYNSKKYLSSLM